MREPQGYTVPRAKADEDEFVEFLRAGDPAAGQFECVSCGHGELYVGELPACPSCAGALWERSAWTPFARVLSALGGRLNY